jgi:2,3-bisphosphoglycerate-dependent phosphoglycerate mutase
VLEIVFETHSTTVDNERGIATGWLPGRLSEHGKRQAEELGARRRDDGLSAIYVSDLARAVETAEIAFAGSPLPIHREWRLRECNYGDLNGASVPELDAVRVQHVDEPFPGGESYRTAAARVRKFLDELLAQRDGERVLLIGHGATRFALDHLVNGVPLEQLVAAPFDWQEGWVYRLRAREPSAVSWAARWERRC